MEYHECGQLFGVRNEVADALGLKRGTGSP
jgi:hypothetical protein